MKRFSRIAIITGLAIPVASLVYFAVALLQAARVPDSQDWKSAADVVRKGWTPGDLVVFSPQWAQGASPWLSDLNVDTGENPDWYDASKAGRVWVIASMDGRHAEPPDGWKELSTNKLAKTTVRLWRPPAGRTHVYGFREHIGDALISRVRGPRREICSNLKDSRWYCGREHPWLFVGQDSKDIAGRVRDVIWAHAVDKAVLETAWPEVPAGKTLTIRYGLTQRAAESREGSPVVFKAFLNGKVVLDAVLQPDEWGWVTKDVELDGKGTSEVKFHVSAPNTQSRQLCFDADVWQ